MSEDFMEVTYDKFLFRVRKGFFPHPEECWAKEGYSSGSFFMEKLN
jgi:hypothetical protein